MIKYINTQKVLNAYTQGNDAARHILICALLELERGINDNFELMQARYGSYLNDNFQEIGAYIVEGDKIKS